MNEMVKAIVIAKEAGEAEKKKTGKENAAIVIANDGEE